MPMEMRELRTHDDIRTAVEGKATKYGTLELPLVVPVNIMDDFCEYLGRALDLDVPSLIVLPIDYSLDVTISEELGTETVAT